VLFQEELHLAHAGDDLSRDRAPAWHEPVGEASHRGILGLTLRPGQHAQHDRQLAGSRDQAEPAADPLDLPVGAGRASLLDEPLPRLKDELAAFIQAACDLLQKGTADLPTLAIGRQPEMLG
jgi:hypothetical protein